MKERNRDQAWRMIVGFDRRRPTSDDIQMPTRRGNVGGRRSEASGFPARPGGVMPRHDKLMYIDEAFCCTVLNEVQQMLPLMYQELIIMLHFIESDSW